MDIIEAVNLFLVGENEEAAKRHYVFDTYDAARKHADDNGLKVWSVRAVLDFSTMAEE